MYLPIHIDMQVYLPTGIIVYTYPLFFYIIEYKSDKPYIRRTQSLSNHMSLLLVSFYFYGILKRLFSSLFNKRSFVTSPLSLSWYIPTYFTGGTNCGLYLGSKLPTYLVHRSQSWRVLLLATTQVGRGAVNEITIYQKKKLRRYIGRSRGTLITLNASSEYRYHTQPLRHQLYRIITVPNLVTTDIYTSSVNPTYLSGTVLYIYAIFFFFWH